MHVNFDRRKKILRAEFVGQDVVTLVNYLLPWRNNAPVGEWLTILEPLCKQEPEPKPVYAPEIDMSKHICKFIAVDEEEGGLAREKCACGVTRLIEDVAYDESETTEEMQAEAFRQLGGKLEDEDEDEMLPQVVGHTPQELDLICSNCEMARWRHMIGSERCQVNGQTLGTFFRPKLMLDDGAVFARTVGESEVSCG